MVSEQFWIYVLLSLGATVLTWVCVRVIVSVAEEQRWYSASVNLG